jgi:uncharacterized protein
MKSLKSLVIVLFIFSLSACTSSSEPVRYYSLSLNSDYKAVRLNLNTREELPRVAVGPIQVPSFLRQEGLVIQIGRHEIYTANYHRWVEPLEEAIAKLLIRELNAKSDTYYFEKSDVRWSKNFNLTLKLEFENFQPTDKSKLSVNGHFWLLNDKQKVEVEEPFGFFEELTYSGYLHSVGQLEVTIKKLAEKIIVSFDKLDTE